MYFLSLSISDSGTLLNMNGVKKKTLLHHFDLGVMDIDVTFVSSITIINIRKPKIISELS